MPTNAPELQQKISSVTVSLLIGMAVIGFFIGTTIAKTQAQDEMQKMQHEFALDEIQGLRSDMNREVQLIRDRLDKMDGKPVE